MRGTVTHQKKIKRKLSLKIIMLQYIQLEFWERCFKKIIKPCLVEIFYILFTVFVFIDVYLFYFISYNYMYCVIFIIPYYGYITSIKDIMKIYIVTLAVPGAFFISICGNKKITFLKNMYRYFTSKTSMCLLSFRLLDYNQTTRDTSLITTDWSWWWYWKN